MNTFLFIIFLLFIIWIIYSVIVKGQEKQTALRELYSLRQKYNITLVHISIIETAYIKKDNLQRFAVIKLDIQNVKNLYNKYEAIFNGTFDDFQTIYFDYICSTYYYANPTTSIEQAIYERIKNHSYIKENPLPISNNNSEVFFVAANEKEDQFDLPENVYSVPLNIIAQITYKDAQGQISQRRITMQSVSKDYDNDYSIYSYCHEKQAQRTFKLSRISKIVDIETGELYTDISKYFTERFNDSPLGRITKCFQELEAEILVLTFIARSDGFMRKKEREIIMQYIAHKSTIELDEILLDKEIKNTYCEAAKFRKVLKIINKKPLEEKQLIIETCNAIILADKKIDPMETGAFELLKTSIKVFS